MGFFSTEPENRSITEIELRIGVPLYDASGVWKAEILEIDRQFGLVTYIYNPCGTSARLIDVINMRDGETKLRAYGLLYEDDSSLQLVIKKNVAIEAAKEKYKDRIVDYSEQEQENVNNPHFVYPFNTRIIRT